MITINHLPIKRVGVTGSSERVTEEQLMSLRAVYERLWPFEELHHGVCIEGDEKAHRLCREMFGSEVVIHGWPPINEKKMAFLWDVDVWHPPMEYKARDNEIAYGTQALIAMPKTAHEILHSGTWVTVRRAYAHIRPIAIVRPNGDIQTDWRPELVTGRIRPEDCRVWGYEWDTIRDRFRPPRREGDVTLEDAFLA